MNSSQGIRTSYRGYEFRSRAEARWAAFFDIVRWPWAYEPFDEEGYIPDFVLRFTHEPVLVEVKGGCVTEAALSGETGKLERAALHRRSTHALMLGAAPMGIDRYGNHSIGLLGQRFDDIREFTWGGALVSGPCGDHHFSIYHQDAAFHCVSCGRYSGGRGPHPGSDAEDAERVSSLVLSAWAEASNRTKWRRWSA